MWSEKASKKVDLCSYDGGERVEFDSNDRSKNDSEFDLKITFSPDFHTLTLLIVVLVCIFPRNDAQVLHKCV